MTQIDTITKAICKTHRPQDEVNGYGHNRFTGEREGFVDRTGLNVMMVGRSAALPREVKEQLIDELAGLAAMKRCGFDYLERWAEHADVLLREEGLGLDGPGLGIRAIRKVVDRVYGHQEEGWSAARMAQMLHDHGNYVESPADAKALEDHLLVGRKIAEGEKVARRNHVAWLLQSRT